MAASFTPRADDVYIASYPRSGTTRLQVMLSALLPGGSPPYEHISQAVPFLDRIILRSLDHLEAMPSPRLLKTHRHFRHLAGRPGRYIYVARDGRDVAVSYYHFYRSYAGWTRPFAEFFEEFLTGRLLYGSWFRHVADWAAAVNEPLVHFVTYEEMTADPQAAMRELAAFCEWNVAAETFDAALEQSSFDSMRQQEHKFDPVIERALEDGRSPSQPAPARPAGAFVRCGRIGSWREVLTPEQALAFERQAAAVFPNDTSRSTVSRQYAGGRLDPGTVSTP